MARFFDRVKETSTTTGTGNVTLAGAATQYRAFSAVYAVGDQDIPYCIAGQNGAEWEVGLGTYVSSNTLQRDKVYASSNSNALVNFSAGTKDVFVTAAAATEVDHGKVMSVTRGLAMPG